jgi:predicted Fe-Mo cluster-binding NifX family protein
MKIALTATAPSLEAEMESRFGRSPYFILVDPETMEYDALENPAASAGGGAGIQAAQTVLDHQAEAVISGNIGPNAMRVLQTAGVKVFLGRPALIKELVEDYKQDKLSPVDQANRPSHFGMK